MEEKIQVVDNNQFEKVLKEQSLKIDNLANKIDKLSSNIDAIIECLA